MSETTTLPRALDLIRFVAREALDATAPEDDGPDLPAYWHLRAALFEILEVVRAPQPPPF